MIRKRPLLFGILFAGGLAALGNGPGCLGQIMTTGRQPGRSPLPRR